MPVMHGTVSLDLRIGPLALLRVERLRKIYIPNIQGLQPA